MKTALFMSKFNYNYNIDCIFHSMKLRAKQKSEAMAETLKIDIIKIKGLAPLDETEIIAERINNSDQFLMIVGHLPHLSKLAPLLLCGDKNKLIIFFQMGWIVCLQRNKKIWSVRWIITPENISDI